MATINTQGAVLQRQNLSLSPVAYETVGQLVNIGEIGVERALIDITNLASTIREYQGAIPDGAEIDFSLQYDPDDTKQTGLKTDLDNNTARLFKVLLGDSPATDFSFTGLVISWKISNAIDNIVPLEVRIKITGSLSIT